jgi:hypothetical protein
MKAYLLRVRATLLLLLIVLVLDSLSRAGILPSQELLNHEIRTILLERGPLALAFVTILESTVGINLYFPGSILILTTMALTAGNVPLAMSTFSVIFIFLCLTYSLDFIIGKYIDRVLVPFSHLKTIGSGVVRFLKIPRPSDNPTPVKTLFSNKSTRAESWGFYLIAFWHPQTGSFASYHIGGKGVNFIMFLKHMVPACFLWSVFWGITMYNIGGITENQFELSSVYYVFIIVLLLYELFQQIAEIKESQTK